ncbi:hypothetical protein A3B87_00680 [Candidatus Kuenenbacteria bacterium RIFCSPHIGHO2_02_FULL_39_13]|uniref:HTH arsR-type domain-containing protein n=1 Tax=Candidatus Kuenenbacteria bacterium RIFCSPHIGHO2_02_FULL_39_13 TaxID=1798561 RepID=A0A1F6FP29_9BACT|nr:MAG: hypothetical protein A3B87_00680 [Candidatus Kuenenbacteria bacterium RIFCSPHIGHO2_02_FULL_39_13]
MLEDLFGSKTRAKLLTLFFNNIDSAFYVRGIARDLKENINSIRREVLNLEKLGIIKSVPLDKIDVPKEELARDKQENRKYYQVNKEYTMFNELHSLIIRSKLLVDKAMLEKLKEMNGIKLLVLSGIFVSDVRARTDILIMGNVDKNKIRRLISGMEKNFSNPIRYSVMTQKEFDYRNQMTDKFLFEIMEGKKHVVVDRRQ